MMYCCKNKIKMCDSSIHYYLCESDMVWGFVTPLVLCLKIIAAIKIIFASNKLWYEINHLFINNKLQTCFFCIQKIMKCCGTESAVSIIRSVVWVMMCSTPVSSTTEELQKEKKAELMTEERKIMPQTLYALVLLLPPILQFKYN